jgi:hypothetical protein
MGILLVGIVIVIVLALMLEGKRQERRYGPSTGRALMRTGLLELQRHLEPDRKVEIVLEQREETEAAWSGELFSSLKLESFAQPEWNGPDSVRWALRAVLGAHDQESATRAWHEILYAVGNNHSGTYYPVILPVLPILKDLLASGSEWTRYTVIEAFIDLLAAFEPVPGFETVEMEGQAARLQDLVVESISESQGTLEEISRSGEAGAEGAREVLDLILHWGEV